MGNLRSAFTTLAGFSVTGINDLVNFDSVNLINDTDLPLMFPLFFGQEVRVNGTVWTSHGFVNGGEYKFVFPHVCLMEAVGLGKLSAKQDTLITLVENYIAAIETDIDIGGYLDRGGSFELRYGQVYFRQRAFTGFVAIHTWNINP